MTAAPPPPNWLTQCSLRLDSHKFHDNVGTVCGCAVTGEYGADLGRNLEGHQGSLSLLISLVGEGGVKDVGDGVLIVGNLVNLMAALKHFFTPQGGHYLGQAWLVFFGRGVVMGGLAGQSTVLALLQGRHLVRLPSCCSKITETESWHRSGHRRCGRCGPRLLRCFPPVQSVMVPHGCVGLWDTLNVSPELRPSVCASTHGLWLGTTEGTVSSSQLGHEAHHCPGELVRRRILIWRREGHSGVISMIREPRNQKPKENFCTLSLRWRSYETRWRKKRWEAWLLGQTPKILDPTGPTMQIWSIFISCRLNG